ncbi:aldose 1-epimerase [Lutibacter oceani]|uniref:Aldose 1-epimerase n=1 Tax=Lutibacter oceani TaxID=1853311 RepID=A0A3D9RJ91_9FLAO|nr:aldose 1-epimerase [Lutibacter oceani]REE79953.1 aldose 1-epimerase [Lutibacter oceani]
MILISTDKNSIVKIEKGELISYQKNGEELMHQKGNPGWRNSDTEMFPIIGPTEANNFSVVTPKGNYSQDQHGLLRELHYTAKNQTENSCTFIKKYTAYTAVENSKYPEKSSARLLSWPYNFSFKKSFELTNTSLKITFEVIAEKGMPFMLGYHPAFMLNGNLDELVKTETKEVTIPEIMEGGDTAYPVLNTSEISLLKKTGFNIKIKTRGFNNFMLWTPVKNMLCIEPITAYPYTGGEMLAKELFNISKESDIFKVELIPS